MTPLDQPTVTKQKGQILIQQCPCGKERGNSLMEEEGKTDSPINIDIVP
jgi:hypothetical protein